MKAGSTFATFLSKGTTLTLPRGATLARSRAAIAAAAFGVAFAATAAHAQTAPQQAPAPGQVRVIAQSSVPPYAAPGAVKTTQAAPQTQTAVKPAAQTTAPAPTAPKPAGIAAPAPAPSFQTRAQAAPSPAPAPAAAPSGGRGNWTQNQQTRPHDHDRRDRNTYGSQPFALGAVIGAALGVGAPVYAAPAYPPQPVAVAPGYVDPAYADPGYAQGGYAGPQGAYAQSYPAETRGAGYRAEDARDPGFPRNYSVAGGIENLPQTLQIGGEQLDTQTVFATIAAARITGVTPAALLALQSRSYEAVETVRQSAGEDDPNMPIDGPYAYSTDRWQASIAKFGPSIGLGGALEKITGVSSQDLGADRSSLNSMRVDPYISGLMAGAEMAANDIAYRQAFGSGPQMAELVVGHHAGREAMLRLSQVYRQAPGTPMAALIKPNYLRDLVQLTGLGHVQPQGGQWTVGSFIGTLDNALKNGLTRYAQVDRMALPPSYKPLERSMASAGRDLPPAAPTPRF